MAQIAFDKTEETDTEKAPDANADKLRVILERFTIYADAEKSQRAREIEDLKFVDFDEQWPDDIKALRAGQAAVGTFPAVAAKPCLTINKLKQPIQIVTNQARQARLALSFAAKGGEASVETAEAYEDIVRAIQTDSRAHVARQWAFERAAKCGRGFYRILTDYANDGDHDQDIIYKRIPNQSSVYLDPFATEPDWSDGEGAFITADMPIARLKREHPKSKIATADSDELSSIGDDAPGWLSTDEHGNQIARVAEHFYVEHVTKTVCLYVRDDGSEVTLEQDDPLAKGLSKAQGPDGKPIERSVDVRSVKWCLLTGAEILDERDWLGRYIPIVPVIGNESNVNGERRWTGLVRSSREAQISYNVMRSAQVEAVALAPKAPWVAYAETLEGFDDFWKQANTRNFPYLPVRKVIDGSGHALPPPQRNVVEPAIQAITLAAHEADADIKSTSGVEDASLGNLNPQERSGKAILALQKQAEIGSAGYLDNLASMSMIHEGKILKDLLPKIYNRPGRIVAAMGADDQRSSLILGKPFIPKGKGTPTEVPEGTPGAQIIDLAKGDYTVSVSVGKSFTTRREEGVSAMGEVIAAVPELMSIVGDLYVENMDFPGARQMADRMKKALPPQFQEDEEQPIPPKVLQQMQQMQQAFDLMTKELNEKTKLIETDAVKANHDLEKERLKHHTDLETTRMTEETKLRIAEINAQLKQQQAQIDAQNAERDRQSQAQEGDRQRQHESQQGAADRRHEQSSNVFEAGVDAIQQDATRAHAMVEADTQRQHDAQMSEQQQGHEQEMAEQQAAQQPQGT